MAFTFGLENHSVSRDFKSARKKPGQVLADDS